MSLKRSVGSMGRAFGGADSGAKVGKQELHDELTKLHKAGQPFTPVDVALSIGAGEPQVSRLLLGLAAEGVLDKVDLGKYRVAAMFADLSMPEFLKTFTRATKTDSTRQRDLSDIARLKQNNDVMRAKLLQAIAERDHYLAACKRHGIDPGPPPAPPVPPAAGSENGQAVPPEPGTSGDAGSSAAGA
jgi:hypothetical protein